MLRKVDIVGISITSEKKKKILEYVFNFLQNSSQKGYIVTPNPEMVVAAGQDPEFKDILNKADVALADGVGLTLAAQLLGKELQDRVTGVDFIESLCNISREKPISMGFLGGGPQIAQRAVECLQKKYPWIVVKYVSEEWEGLKNGWRDDVPDTVRYSQLEDRVKSVGKSSGKRHIDILFVAFGAPKQEKWIVSHLGDLPVTLAMGVGGAFDYLSETISRAPKPLRALGLEWLYRLIRQPWRWRRQLALLTFIRLVLQEKFT